jgi:hypothetical protein
MQAMIEEERCSLSLKGCIVDHRSLLEKGLKFLHLAPKLQSEEEMRRLAPRPLRLYR